MAATARRLLLLCLALAFAVGTAAAQSRVLVTTVGSASNPDTAWLFQLPSQRIEATVPLNLGRGVFTASGRRFISVLGDGAAGGPLQVWIADLGTGDIATDGLPGYDAAVLVANPRVDEAYAALHIPGTGNAVLARLSRGGTTPLRRCVFSRATVSRDGRRVFCYDATDGFVWIDTATGVTVDQFDIGGVGQLAADAAGARVLVARPTGLGIVDVAARRVVQQAPLPLSPGMAFSRLLGDGPDAGGVFVHGSGPAGRETVLVDPLTLGARQRLPLPPDRDVYSLKVLPDGRTALVASTTGLTAVVDAVDLPTNQLTFSTPMFAAWQFAYLATTSVPLPPASVQASVTGGTVQLTWAVPSISDGVATIVVEAGSRSGVTDLAELRVNGGDTALTVAGVPPGRYFVRLRSANFTGISPPSTEVVIDVPAAATPR